MTDGNPRGQSTGRTLSRGTVTQAVERIRRSPRGPRSLPKVGAVCVNAHVRIWCARRTGKKAGGASPLERRSNQTTFAREPCVGSREGAGEASVAVRMGRAIEHRKNDDPGCRGFQIGRRQHRGHRIGEMSASPARIRPQAATPVDVGATASIAALPLQLEAVGTHDGASLATRIHPPPFAGPTVHRQSPKVGAGWFNDHVRNCAGGAWQHAFLPQLRGAPGNRRPYRECARHGAQRAGVPPVGFTVVGGGIPPGVERWGAWSGHRRP